MKDSSGKQRAGIHAAVWTIAFLALLLAFLVKQEDIIRSLKETAFFEHVFGSRPEFIEKFEIPPETPDTPAAEQPALIVVASEKEPESAASTAAEQKSPPAQAGTESAAGTEKTGTEKTDSTTEAAAPPTESAPAVTHGGSKNTAGTAAKPPVPPVAKMNQYICFIAISGDGIVERKEVNRTVPKTNTPLSAALTALLEGPAIPELEKGYISLIPQGTKLLSASIQNKTAFINFSQEFAFNRYGVDGYLGQLMQVVYTATAFATIENVQFLIEGQKTEYLGGEGVWIGTPLARYNFK